MSNNFFSKKPYFSGGFALFLSILLLVVGCSYSVALPELSHKVPVKRFRQNLIVVIDQNTLNTAIRIPSHSPVYVHNWKARIGEMLMQVADSELALFFNQYQTVTVLDQYVWADDVVVMELTVQDYLYQHGKSYVSINAVVYKHNEQVLMQSLYSAYGESRSSNRLPTDTFKKKMIVREATQAALTQIFNRLRNDLTGIVASNFD